MKKMTLTIASLIMSVFAIKAMPSKKMQLLTTNKIIQQLEQKQVILTCGRGSHGSPV